MCENPLGTPGSWALCTRAKAAEDENRRLRREIERLRFVKEILDASQRVDELPDWMKTMRDRSVEASEYTKGIETMGAEFDEGFAIGINENQSHDHAAELLALRKAAKAADQARKPRGEPLEVLSDPPEFRPPVMAILERLTAAETEIARLRAALQAIVDDKITNPAAWEIAKGALLP